MSTRLSSLPSLSPRSVRRKNSQINDPATQLKEMVNDLESEKREYAKAHQHLVSNTESVIEANKILKDAIEDRKSYYEEILHRYNKSNSKLQAAFDQNKKMTKICKAYKIRINQFNKIKKSKGKNSKSEIFDTEQEIKRFRDQISEIEEKCAQIMEKYPEEEIQIRNYRILASLITKLARVNELFEKEIRNIPNLDKSYLLNARDYQKYQYLADQIKLEMNMLNIEKLKPPFSEESIVKMTKLLHKCLPIYNQILFIAKTVNEFSDKSLLNFDTSIALSVTEPYYDQSSAKRNSSKRTNYFYDKDTMIGKNVELEEEINALRQILDSNGYNYIKRSKSRQKMIDDFERDFARVRDFNPRGDYAVLTLDSDQSNQIESEKNKLDNKDTEFLLLNQSSKIIEPNTDKKHSPRNQKIVRKKHTRPNSLKSKSHPKDTKRDNKKIEEDVEGILFVEPQNGILMVGVDKGIIKLDNKKTKKESKKEKFDHNSGDGQLNLENYENETENCENESKGKNRNEKPENANETTIFSVNSENRRIESEKNNYYSDYYSDNYYSNNRSQNSQYSGNNYSGRNSEVNYSNNYSPNSRYSYSSYSYQSGKSSRTSEKDTPNRMQEKPKSLDDVEEGEFFSLSGLLIEEEEEECADDVDPLQFPSQTTSQSSLQPIPDNLFIDDVELGNLAIVDTDSEKNEGTKLTKENSNLINKDKKISSSSVDFDVINSSDASERRLYLMDRRNNNHRGVEPIEPFPRNEPENEQNINLSNSISTSTSELEKTKNEEEACYATLDLFEDVTDPTDESTHDFSSNPDDEGVLNVLDLTAQLDQKQNSLRCLSSQSEGFLDEDEMEKRRMFNQKAAQMMEHIPSHKNAVEFLDLTEEEEQFEVLFVSQTESGKSLNDSDLSQPAPASILSLNNNSNNTENDHSSSFEKKIISSETSKISNNTIKDKCIDDKINNEEINQAEMTNIHEYTNLNSETSKHLEKTSSQSVIDKQTEESTSNQLQNLISSDTNPQILTESSKNIDSLSTKSKVLDLIEVNDTTQYQSVSQSSTPLHSEASNDIDEISSKSKQIEIVTTQEAVGKLNPDSNAALKEQNHNAAILSEFDQTDAEENSPKFEKCHVVNASLQMLSETGSSAIPHSDNDYSYSYSASEDGNNDKTDINSTLKKNTMILLGFDENDKSNKSSQILDSESSNLLFSTATSQIKELAEVSEAKTSDNLSDSVIKSGINETVKPSIGSESSTALMANSSHSKIADLEDNSNEYYSDEMIGYEEDEEERPKPKLGKCFFVNASLQMISDTESYTTQSGTSFSDASRDHCVIKDSEVSTQEENESLADSQSIINPHVSWNLPPDAIERQKNQSMIKKAGSTCVSPQKISFNLQPKEQDDEFFTRVNKAQKIHIDPEIQELLRNGDFDDLLKQNEERGNSANDLDSQSDSENDVEIVRPEQRPKLSSCHIVNASLEMMSDHSENDVSNSTTNSSCDSFIPDNDRLSRRGNHPEIVYYKHAEQNQQPDSTSNSQSVDNDDNSEGSVNSKNIILLGSEHEQFEDEFKFEPGPNEEKTIYDYIEDESNHKSQNESNLEAQDDSQESERKVFVKLTTSKFFVNVMKEEEFSDTYSIYSNVDEMSSENFYNEIAARREAMLSRRKRGRDSVLSNSTQTEEESESIIDEVNNASPLINEPPITIGHPHESELFSITEFEEEDINDDNENDSIQTEFIINIPPVISDFDSEMCSQISHTSSKSRMKEIHETKEITDDKEISEKMNEEIHEGVDEKERSVKFDKDQLLGTVNEIISECSSILSESSEHNRMDDLDGYTEGFDFPEEIQTIFDEIDERRSLSNASEKGTIADSQKSERERLKHNKSEPNKSEHNESEPNKSEHNESEPNKSEHNESEPNKSEHNESEHIKTGSENPSERNKSHIEIKEEESPEIFDYIVETRNIVSNNNDVNIFGVKEYYSSYSSEGHSSPVEVVPISDSEDEEEETPSQQDQNQQSKYQTEEEEGKVYTTSKFKLEEPPNISESESDNESHHTACSSELLIPLDDGANASICTDPLSVQSPRSDGGSSAFSSPIIRNEEIEKIYETPRAVTSDSEQKNHRNQKRIKYAVKIQHFLKSGRREILERKRITPLPDQINQNQMKNKKLINDFENEDEISNNLQFLPNNESENEKMQSEKTNSYNDISAPFNSSTASNESETTDRQSYIDNHNNNPETMSNGSSPSIQNQYPNQTDQRNPGEKQQNQKEKGKGRKTKTQNRSQKSPRRKKTKNEKEIRKDENNTKSKSKQTKNNSNRKTNSRSSSQHRCKKLRNEISDTRHQLHLLQSSCTDVMSQIELDEFKKSRRNYENKESLSIRPTSSVFNYKDKRIQADFDINALESQVEANKKIILVKPALEHNYQTLNEFKSKLLVKYNQLQNEEAVLSDSFEKLTERLNEVKKICDYEHPNTKRRKELEGEIEFQKQVLEEVEKQKKSHAANKSKLLIRIKDLKCLHEMIKKKIAEQLKAPKQNVASLIKQLETNKIKEKEYKEKIKMQRLEENQLNARKKELLSKNEEILRKQKENLEIREEIRQLKNEFFGKSNQKRVEMKYTLTNPKEMCELEQLDNELQQRLKENAKNMNDMKNRIVNISRALFSAKVSFPRTPQVPLPF
ncbi:hypothetical protein TRFO_40103 [Tritrichomonas foetus]|uniref:Uncharacterized protein n=1 Tax=Tritrichomonas foetus TaxID=1144522 RepID=A0A1J4J8Q6_9EUKA|nr:hypothetical protein TRFO_40103 [Tritrichomonas foetus]|eukprot:OHS93612.1 hypothetical protein TRFO_40103 [Tritrichomonas foetus]